MKGISSSIVVAAGMYGILASGPALRASSSLFSLIGFVAGLVALSLGLVGWWASLKYDR
jgi:hypothetical protein